MIGAQLGKLPDMKGETAEENGNIPSTFSGAWQNMLRTVTSVERYQSIIKNRP